MPGADEQAVTISVAEWTALTARIATLEANQGATASSIAQLREDFKTIETRLYAIVATGILAGPGIAAVASHFLG